MPLYDLTEFFKLSSVLNYNLSATSLNRYNILMFIIGNKRLHPVEKKDKEHKGFLMEALGIIFEAYSEKRRRLGPMAVLHPIRATALLCQAIDQTNMVKVLTALFHDILEDIRPVDFVPAKWRDLETRIYSLLSRMDPEDEERLIGNLECLTRVGEESYYHYIGRLLECPHGCRDVVQTKLADRLDNTLDMRIELQDPLEGIDFFQHIFQVMFVSNYQGYQPKTEHRSSTALNSARRLYQLFKNAVLLSLIRQKLPREGDCDYQVLFNVLSGASLKEAQRTLIHLVGYHYKDVEKQRPLLLEAMDYCHRGRSDLVTKPEGDQILDGLFSSYFGQDSKEVRNQMLDALYQNKPLMIEASIAFIAIFLSFLNDSQFYIRGITADGMEPE